MKILFISSGNSKDGISPIIFNQGESLKKHPNIELDYYTIKGKGIRGYLKNVSPLRKEISINKYDIIHAHYSLSAFVASLAGAKPLVVSLMGSDVKASRFHAFIIKLFNLIFKWELLFVKSEDMKKSINIKDADVIPNGVDINLFRPLNKQECQERLGWDSNKKHILFAAKSSRIEKNFLLAQSALNYINDPTIILHSLEDIPNFEMPIWYNASDVVILTSLWEGSPNVIKEAMACNRPIVATEVGDIEFLFGNIPNCYLTDFTIAKTATQIKAALKIVTNSNLTPIRERINILKLDSHSIALKIIEHYNSVIKKCN